MDPWFGTLDRLREEGACGALEGAGGRKEYTGGPADGGQ